MSNNITNMIQAARDSNAVDFSRSFHSEMRERLTSAIADRRIDVIGGMFGGGQSSNDKSGDE